MTKQKSIFGFIALTIAMFMGTLDSTIINIALPSIATYFNSNLKDTSWISTIYVLGLSVFMITASKLADQFGRKKMMIIGLTLFGVSSAICGLSSSLLLLIVMRFIQGIGGAIITPIVVPMGLEIFGKGKAQFVAAIVGAVTALAAAGGPPIGALLIDYINWQVIFFVNVPLALISIMLTSLFIKESYDKTVSKSIDWVGMFLLTTTLFLLIFALLKGNDYGWTSSIIVSMFIGSATTLALFIFTESKVPSPMLELSLFSEPTFSFSSVCYLITGFAIVSPVLIFNYFLQNALGYEVLNAAFIVMAVSLTVIVSMPLGNAIASKFDARPVNFLGAILMGVGVLLLSQLKINTSKPAMICDMIVFGFGLGFSCQSLVSSIKFLPPEKSGIGSGIVNAARQIGTCIGIALLVSMLDANVSNAKINIRNDAISKIHHTKIVNFIKIIMIKDISDSLDGNNNLSETEQNDLQKKLKKDIQQHLSALTTAPRPDGNKELAKLYDGTTKLSTGASNASDGQKILNTGIETLGLGLDTMYSGSESLTSGVGDLDSGLSQTLSASQALNSASKQGLNTLSSGIGKVNDGTQKILGQFFTSGNSNSPTIYDGVTGVASGVQSLSSNMNSYISAVNSTFYLMIKSDPNSSQLLTVYKSSLEQAQTAYQKSDGTSKEQYKQKVQALSNLVNLYMIGTDSSVTNEQQFQEKLITIAKQSQTNQNIVSGGNNIIVGASKLSSASEKLDVQFADGGTFKNGMIQLAYGADNLNKSTVSLISLQTGISNVTNGLSKLKGGSTKLLTGSQYLQNGIKSSKDGSEQLLSGSNKLVEANVKIKGGAIQIASYARLSGQQSEIQSTVNAIKTLKDNDIAGAFDKTFMIPALILIFASICGIFTDRSNKKISAKRSLS